MFGFFIPLHWRGARRAGWFCSLSLLGVARNEAISFIAPDRYGSTPLGDYLILPLQTPLYPLADILEFHK
jgi:hypothetical protein